MDDPFVTLAQVDDAEEAKRLRLRLEAAGLRSIVPEPGTVRVVAEDLAEAQVVLQDWANEKTPQESTADEEDDVDSRETMAAKAFRCAVFAWLIPVLLPLLLYSVYLLYRVWQLPGPLDRATRGYVWKTLTVLLLPFVVVLGLVIFAPLFHDPDADMAQLPRPDVLVGHWVSDEVGNEKVLLDLFEDGTMRYRVVGPAPLDYKGLWGYAEHHLHLRFRERLQGPMNMIGTHSAIRNERLRGDDLFLRVGGDNREPLPFHRQ